MQAEAENTSNRSRTTPGSASAIFLAAEQRCINMIKAGRVSVLWSEQSLMSKAYLHGVMSPAVEQDDGIEAATGPKLSKGLKYFGGLSAGWTSYISAVDPTTWTDDTLTKIRVVDKNLPKS